MLDLKRILWYNFVVRVAELNPYEIEGYNNMLDGKKILFVGNSFTYYGKTVIEKGVQVLTQAERGNDKGFFYQLCHEKGMNVSVTNWTFGAHRLSDSLGVCTANKSCKGTDHLSYLVDRNFDYVVLQQGTVTQTSVEFLSIIDAAIAIFKKANPHVKFAFLMQYRIHEQMYEWRSAIKELEARGVTVVDWGALVWDLITGAAVVPNTKEGYNRNTFIISKSESDGYHPNMLTGYITTLMTYCALTGDSAVGQPYKFCGDAKINLAFDFEKFKSSFYTYGDSSTNFDTVLKSAENIRGIQELVDKYLAEKRFLTY